MTLRLNDAQHELLDPSLRARYDRGFAGPSAPRASSSSGPPARTTAPRAREDRRPPHRADGEPRPRAEVTPGHPAWRVAVLVSIAAILVLTAVVFAWSYSGQLALTPRVIPPLVIAVGWLVGGLRRTSMLFVALLVIGAGLWPLSASGIAPFVLLSDTVPPAVLACLSVFALAVLVLRVSAPHATRLPRFRAFPV